MRARSVVTSSLLGCTILLAACSSTPSTTTTTTTTQPAKAKAATTSGLPSVCAAPDEINGHPTITCTWEISAQPNPSSLISQINAWLTTSYSGAMSASSQVWIEAWGGKGAGSTNSGCVNSGGAGGTAGYAQTITTEGALSQLQKLYLYTAVEGASYSSSGVSCHGGGGASSTLVTTVQISSSSFSFASDTLAIAGGGGVGPASATCRPPTGTEAAPAAWPSQRVPRRCRSGAETATGTTLVPEATRTTRSTGDAERRRRRGWQRPSRALAAPATAAPTAPPPTRRVGSRPAAVDSNLGTYTAGSGAGKGDNSSGSGGGGYGGGGTGDTCSGTSDSAGSGGGGGSYAAGGDRHGQQCTHEPAVEPRRFLRPR